MIRLQKDAALAEAKIPFGVAEVRYPAREEWREADFRALVEQEISGLRDLFGAYDRKAVFGENPYVRFFKKFKKTYPVLLQYESIVCKGKPFPRDNPITQVPFLLELTTRVLSGTHDIEQLRGDVELYLSTGKTAFPGMRGFEIHTYPGDFCARDEGGIIFSEIAGADERSCARPDSSHVFYPIFGTPELPETVITDAAKALTRYIRVLAPTAQIKTIVI